MSGQPAGQLTYVYDLFREMEGYSVNQLYHGDFSTTSTDNILSAVESCLLTINYDVKLRKRLYFLTVEALQNITRHEEKVDPSLKGNCFFLLQGIGPVFYITSGNYIANNRIQALQARLDAVNSLDTESLRAYAKELMEAGGYSGRGGAGLGLIEMARKSEHKLQYSFVNFNDKVSYFYFQIKIDLSDVISPNLTPKDVTAFENAQLIHQYTDKYKLAFVYAGSFSSAKPELLDAIFAHSFNSVAVNTASSLILETGKVLMSNIVRHAATGLNPHTHNETNNGIFVVSKVDGHLIFTTGNSVKKNNIKLREMAELSNDGNATIIGKLGRLSSIYTAVNGQLSFQLLPADAQNDFFITSVKI